MVLSEVVYAFYIRAVVRMGLSCAEARSRSVSMFPEALFPWQSLCSNEKQVVGDPRLLNRVQSSVCMPPVFATKELPLLNSVVPEVFQATNKNKSLLFALNERGERRTQALFFTPEGSLTPFIL